MNRQEASAFQLELAAWLDVAIDTESFMVAAAQLHDHVAPAISDQHEIQAATDKQISYGKKLGINLKSESRGVASAKIHEELVQNRWRAISEKSLRTGMTVWWQRKNKEVIISQITDDGRLRCRKSSSEYVYPQDVSVC